VPRVVFEVPAGRSAVVDVAEGTTLLEAARRGAVAIEGACGGNMACATCHVYLPDAMRARLPRASAEEADMLDFAEGLTRESRLACQVRVTAAVDGMVVRVPASSLLE
jgi:2Fe-2S ferredoxin